MISFKEFTTATPVQFFGDRTDRIADWSKDHSGRPGTASALIEIVWYNHRRYAVEEVGVSQRTVEAIAACKRPRSLRPEMLDAKQVSDATFRAAIDRFGERTVVELTALSAYHPLSRSYLNYAKQVSIWVLQDNEVIVRPISPRVASRSNRD